eukprot:sb/3464317/
MFVRLFSGPGKIDLVTKHLFQTKCDTGVRDALQLPADKFEVMVNLSENEASLSLGDALATSGVLGDVQKNLGIDSERFDLVAEQYSLNMYGKGGHFKKHKDTPRGSDMVGTLLVQLPGAYYEGGALEISVGDGFKTKLVLEGHKIPEHSYDWDDFDWQLPDPTKLRIAAFFCDIDHEVLKVEEGLRLTAAFILRIKEKVVPEVPSANLNSTVIPKTLSSSEKEAALAAKFIELCNDVAFLPTKPMIVDITDEWQRKRGEQRFDKRPRPFLAFPCFHLYTNSQVFKKKGESAKLPLTDTQVAALKGKDSILGKAVLSASEQTGGAVKIYLQPLVDHEFTKADYEGRGPYMLPKFPPPKLKIPSQMSDESIEKKFKTTGNLRHDIWPIWVFDEELGHKPDVIGETEWNEEGYFGNEASDIEFYVKSLLRVEFAPYDQRKMLIDLAVHQLNKENQAGISKRKGNSSVNSKAKRGKKIGA